MRAKHLKTNFWLTPINNNFSSTKKTILQQRYLAANIMNRQTVNGEHTDLWSDPWINHKSLVDLIGWSRVSMRSTSHSKVSSIIKDGQL